MMAGPKFLSVFQTMRSRLCCKAIRAVVWSGTRLEGQRLRLKSRCVSVMKCDTRLRNSIGISLSSGFQFDRINKVFGGRGGEPAKNILVFVSFRKRVQSGSCGPEVYRGLGQKFSPNPSRERSEVGTAVVGAHRLWNAM